MKESLIIGGGAWGTAIANLVAENSNKKTFIWTLEENVKRDINRSLVNKSFLPKIKLNKNIEATNNFIKPNSLDIVYIVVPSQYVHDVLKKFVIEREKYNLEINPIYVICSKGIDLKRKKFLSDIIYQITSSKKIAILSGPTFAVQLAKKMPSAVTLACKSKKQSEYIIKRLSNSYFRLYTTNDILGVQINGILKNVLAIAAGITEGLGLGENARAALITRGIKEIFIIMKCVGGKKNTVLGLSGLGDILLTCNSRHSRNYSFGFYLGKGKKLKNILSGNKQVTEGLENIKFIYFIKTKFKVDTPIFDSIYKILIQQVNIKKIVKELLKRPQKKEY